MLVHEVLIMFLNFQNYSEKYNKKPEVRTLGTLGLKYFEWSYYKGLF